MLISHTFCGTESKTSGAKQDGRNEIIVYVSRIGTNGDCSQKDPTDSSDERNRRSYGIDQGSVSKHWAVIMTELQNQYIFHESDGQCKNCVPCITGTGNVTRMKRSCRILDLFASGAL